jgi:hypothetical protein
MYLLACGSRFHTIPPRAHRRCLKLRRESRALSARRTEASASRSVWNGLDGLLPICLGRSVEGALAFLSPCRFSSAPWELLGLRNP